MSDTVTKRLNVSDVTTFPYEANKSWVVTSQSFQSSGIFFEVGTYPSTTNIQNYTSENLLYKSVLTNYYPEFYPTYSHSTSSYNQTNNYNLSLTTSSYSGFQKLGNPATTYKYFPTNPNSSVYTINIPNSLYSNKILPTTFEMEINGGRIYDDGEYNLLYSGSNQTSSIGTIISQSSYVGNLFYEQGLGVLTIIPMSMVSSSEPPIPPAITEWVVLWAENTGTGGSASWEAQYNFVNEYNVSSSISLTQGIGFYNTIGVLTQVKQGTGYWTTISGTPLTLQSAIVPSFNNISWLVPTNTTGVTANLANNTLVTYPSPLPSGFNNIYGILITGNTAGDGIQYLP